MSCQVIVGTYDVGEAGEEKYLQVFCNKGYFARLKKLKTFSSLCLQFMVKSVVLHVGS